MPEKASTYFTNINELSLTETERQRQGRERKKERKKKEIMFVAVSSQVLSSLQIVTLSDNWNYMAIYKSG